MTLGLEAAAVTASQRLRHVNESAVPVVNELSPEGRRVGNLRDSHLAAQGHVGTASRKRSLTADRPQRALASPHASSPLERPDLQHNSLFLLAPPSRHGDEAVACSAQLLFSLWFSCIIGRGSKEALAQPERFCRPTPRRPAANAEPPCLSALQGMFSAVSVWGLAKQQLGWQELCGAEHNHLHPRCSP